MDPQAALTMAQNALFMLLMVAAPVLATVLAVGLVVSLFQAITQINEATLAFVPKLIAAIAVFAIAGPWMMTTMVEFIRSTPLLIQLFFVYFALPAVGIQVSGFTAAIITMTFLGGAFYSLDMLPAAWRTITLFNPVVYLISGFRWTFFGKGDVGIEVSMAAVALFFALCLGVIFWMFRTGYRLKN